MSKYSARRPNTFGLPFRILNLVTRGSYLQLPKVLKPGTATTAPQGEACIDKDMRVAEIGVTESQGIKNLPADDIVPPARISGFESVGEDLLGEKRRYRQDCQSPQKK